MPIHRTRQDVDLIGRLARPVTLIGIHDQLRRYAQRLHRMIELEGLRRRDFLVALPLQNEDRRVRVLDKRNRGAVRAYTCGSSYTEPPKNGSIHVSMSFCP